MTRPDDVPGDPAGGGPAGERAVAWTVDADMIVVGSGVAGLTAALEAARMGLRPLVVTKASIAEGSTRWAQGGIAAVLREGHEPGDTVAAHLRDTITAGAGLTDPAVAATVVAGGDAAITGLRRRGAVFDTDADGRLALAREGGHSAHRVIHAGGDATGAEVQRTLAAAVQDGRIDVLEHHVALDVRRGSDGAVRGLLVLDGAGAVGFLRAPAVLLATGGTGQLFRATSNPDVATGDGLSLALRCGASVADLEFVQFHPTVLFVPGAVEPRRPLVTEALRGEGAVLIDALGRRIMPGVHPLADLAPRDVVAGAITARMAEAPGGIRDHVFLDATGWDPEWFRGRFPTVWASCREAGVDPATEPIPVSPAAHFSCGGVVSTVDGRSTVPGLYAAGEVARTGLHGANRLASNSLLEGLVLGARAARAVATDLAARRGAESVHPTPAPSARRTSPVDAAHTAPDVRPVADRAALQDLMSRHVAIGRTDAGLADAAATVDSLRHDRPMRTRRDVEDASLTLLALATIEAARARRESRGCHSRLDHPERSDPPGASVVIGLDDGGRPVALDAVTMGGAA